MIGFPKILIFVSFLSSSVCFCNESYYVERGSHLNIRISEYIGISALTKNQVNSKNNSVANHLLFYNHSESYNNFSIVTQEIKKFLP